MDKIKLRPKRDGEDSLYQYVSKRYNISQIARDTELTRPTIIAILNGDTKKPGHEKLAAICKQLNMFWEYDDDGLYFGFMLTDEDPDYRIAEEVASYGNRPDIQELLREIYSLPKAEQDEMWQIVDSIIKLRKSGKK